MSSTLGIGLIGAGVVGQMRARTIVENPATELLAVADLDSAMARTAAGRSAARILSDFRDVLKVPGVEAVVVSSPVHLHEEMVMAALDAAKHVLCEKPLSSTVASCQRLVVAAETRGLCLAVGFNHRYYPSILFLEKVLAQSQIGRVDHWRMLGGHEGLGQFRADWMYRGELSGGGAMMDIGIHLTDLARHLAGEIVTVYGRSTNRVWDVDDSEDNALAILETADGALVSYHATWSEWKGYRFWIEAYGTGGMVRAQYAPTLNLLIRQESPGARRHWSFRPHLSVNLREKLFGWQTTARRAFAAELGDFVKVTGGESQGTRLADGTAGLRAVEIANAVYESSRSGALIRLDSSMRDRSAAEDSPVDRTLPEEGPRRS